jgi:hypothetical protein
MKRVIVQTLSLINSKIGGQIGRLYALSALAIQKAFRKVFNIGPVHPQNAFALEVL